MYYKNNKGSIREPYGTPCIMYKLSDLVLFMLLYDKLNFKNIFIIVIKIHIISWLTIFKALLCLKIMCQYNFYH